MGGSTHAARACHYSACDQPGVIGVKKVRGRQCCDAAAGEGETRALKEHTYA